MERSLYDLVSMAWDKKPEQPALASTRLTLTGKELLETVDHIAKLIAEHAPNTSKTIAISLTPELSAIAILASYRLARPVIAFRPDWSVLAAVDCDLVVSQDPLLETGSLKHLALSNELLQSPTNHEIAPVEIGSSDPIAHYFLTSGSTGEPKIVGLTQDQILKREGYVRPARITGKYFSTLGLGTFGGYMTVLSQLMAGETAFIPTTPELNARLISNWGIDTLFSSPNQVELLLDELDKIEHKVSEIQVTGSALRPKLAAKIQGLGIRASNIYASTESGLVAINDGNFSDETYCGEVNDSVTVEIVDSEGNRMPDGSVGQIRIQSPGQATGYVGREGPSEQFQNGWFYPGDLGAMEQSSLYLRGRTSDVINSGGVKVRPEAIEDFALQFPGVDDAAVFFPEDQAGEIGIAIVSPKSIDGNSLNRFIASKFGEAAPTQIVRIPSIPRSELGKPLRDSIRNIYEEIKIGLE